VKQHCLIIALSILSLRLWAAKFEPFEGGKPLAVLMQSDPWAMVMGADTPRVAVYEDGTVIFVKRNQDGSGASYRSRTLTDAEMSEFKEHLAPLAAVKDLKSFYNLRPGFHDLPEASFYLSVGKREIAVRVYGLMSSGTKLPAYTVMPNKGRPDNLPNELLDLHKFLCSIDYAESKEWIPKYIEVMIWPYEYAPDASISWPKDWPGLDSERAKKRGDSYSIFMDGHLLPDVRNFLRTRNQRGAVEIGRKKWAASVRAVFPSEPVWRDAIQNGKRK